MIATTTLLAVLLVVAAAPSQKGLGQGDLKTVTIRESGYEGMVYHVFTPKAVLPGRLYPLVFALHGNGASAKAHARNIAKVSTAELPVFVLAPQYQKEQKFNAPVYPRAGKIFDMVLRTTLEDQPIDSSRVILEGFSMGSNYSTAWINALAQHPQEADPFPFCAVWLNSTAVPPRKPAHGIPYLLFVGEKETAVLGRINVVENVRRAYKAMFLQNLDVTYIEIPNMGHSVNPECHRIMREHIASLPDHTAAVPPKLAKVFPRMQQLCARGQFAKAMRELDKVMAVASIDRKSKARSLRSKISAHVKRFASTAAKKRHPTLDDYRELKRLDELLAGTKTLHDPVKSALSRLEKNKRFSAELTTWRKFAAAQKLAKNNWKKSLATIKSLATGPHKDTEYGRRAQAHVRAAGPTKSK